MFLQLRWEGGTLNFLALYIGSILESLTFWDPVVEEESQEHDKGFDKGTSIMRLRVWGRGFRVLGLGFKLEHSGAWGGLGFPTQRGLSPLFW